MDGMIGQQFTLDYSDKIDNSLIYAAVRCCGNQSILSSKQIQEQITELTGSVEDIKKRFIPQVFSPNGINKSRFYEKFCII